VLSPIEKEKAFTESLVKGNLIISIPRFFNFEGQFINQPDYYRIVSISVGQPYNNQHVLIEIFLSFCSSLCLRKKDRKKPFIRIKITWVGY